MARYNKKKRNITLPFSASHLMLYIVLMVYVGVAIGGVWTAIYLIRNDFNDYAIQALIGLFSYVGATASIAVSFYSWKAKAENEIAAQNRKYDARFELAKEVYSDLHCGKIDKDSVILLRAIIGGNDETDINSRLTTDTDEQVNKENEYSADKIMEELDELTNALG